MAMKREYLEEVVRKFIEPGTRQQALAVIRRRKYEVIDPLVEILNEAADERSADEIIRLQPYAFLLYLLGKEGSTVARRKWDQLKRYSNPNIQGIVTLIERQLGQLVMAGALAKYRERENEQQ